VASRWRFVSPAEYVYNLSSQFTLGRRASGMPVLEYVNNQAAKTNTIITIPLTPFEVDEGYGQTKVLKKVHVCQLLSATSGGAALVPLVKAYAKVYEVDLAAGKFTIAGPAVTSAGANAGIALPNTATSAGFITDASGTTWTGAPSYIASSIVADIGVSSYVDTYTNIKAQTPEVGETYNHSYRPRLGLTFTALEISASVGASAVWDHFGAFLEYE